MINKITHYQVAVKTSDALPDYEDNLAKINIAGCNACIINDVILFGFIPHEQQAKDIYKAITGDEFNE